MKTKILVFITCLLISLSSCISVKLVPDYSEAIENQIIETQKQNEKLYLELLEQSEDKRTYTSVSKEYLEVESNINSILFQYQAREKKEDFIKMVKNLKDNFMQYKKEHKDKKTLNDGEINLYIAYINGFWQPLLTAEKALKINSHEL
jgi:membrane-bound lytic murein transglycosylase